MPLETQKPVDVTSQSPEADRTRTDITSAEDSLPEATVVPDDTKNAPSTNETSPDSNDEMTKLADQFIAPPTDITKKHLKGIALKAYGSQTRPRNEDKLVLEFLPMVHKITQQVVSYLHPPLSREDLVSAGTIGLVKAARDFDPTKDAEFKTYAYIRIRGAVIDELRSWSFTPSSLKKQFDRAQQILRDVTEKTGHMPSDEHIAEKLGITVEKLYRIFETCRARHFLSIHGVTDDAPALGTSLVAENTNQPGDRIEKQELLGKLTEAIQNLPERQRKIVILYYHQELTMKEIAMVMDVTESRISQLHAAALFKLSTALKDYKDSI